MLDIDRLDNPAHTPKRQPTAPKPKPIRFEKSSSQTPMQKAFPKTIRCD
jgi:hypothetical protein